MARLHCRSNGALVEEADAGGVEEDCSGRHHRKRPAVDHALRLRSESSVQKNESRSSETLGKPDGLGTDCVSSVGATLSDDADPDADRDEGTSNRGSYRTKAYDRCSGAAGQRDARGDRLPAVVGTKPSSTDPI